MEGPCLILTCIMLAFVSRTLAAEQGNCTGLAMEECCKQNCIYVVCRNGTDAIAGCYKLDWNSSATCDNETAELKCNGSSGQTTAVPVSPTAAPDVCAAAGDNMTACCGEGACKFIECNSTAVNATELHTGCHRQDENLTAVCVGGTEKNLCNPATTTTSAPTTKNKTEAPAPTTKVPPTTPAPGPDPCAQLTNVTTCCQAADLKCMYVVCQGLDKAPHLGCHVNTTDLTVYCVENTSNNVCSAEAFTPKASPSTGDEEHGQHFDGASFIGGIVLCLGLVAIIFFGLKFYKARAEKNYHTL